MPGIARFFMILGGVFVVVGFIFLFLPRIPIFKLPGDLVVRKDNLVLLVPIATSVFLSIIITIILNILVRK